jgi:hypothetical protein
MLLNRKWQKVISVFLLVTFLNSTFFPSVSLALTSGPAQPEFSSFESVSTSNMVDAFSGDFTYNLPLIEVPGPHGSSYPISLSYHSGVTPEEEASWVGYGWTLNAGAINRSTRGLPDDYNGNEIIFHNKMPKNWTATLGGGASFGEVFGADLKGMVGGSVNGSLRYNNYRGFGYNVGVGISLGRGLVSMGYHLDDGRSSFSSHVNPWQVLNVLSSERDFDAIKINKERFCHKNFDNYYDKRLSGSSLSSGSSATGSTYGKFSYTETVRPNIVHGYSGQAYNISIGNTLNLGPAPIGVSTNSFGSYSFQINDPSIATKGFGYLYSSEATKADLMDYHVDSERDFNPRETFLGVPFNDADNFVISGEGIGGGFRLYNKTSGHFGPREITSKIDIYNIAVEFGTGWTFGGGMDLGKGESKLSVSDWNRSASLFESRATSQLDEPVFFRFNNDLGGEWGDAHPDDKPFQAGISGGDFTLSPSSSKLNSDDDKRSGRSSYIGYHTNQEMLSGTGPSVESYSKITQVNTSSDRANVSRMDLIGEISVFNTNGTQYNYGLPVYSRNEKTLNYSLKGSTSVTDNYLAYTDNLNDEVKLGTERKSEYASTYLLTEILSPDYLDRGPVTGGESGSSIDDMGGYTRFNYNKFAGSIATPVWYYWRAPYKGLTYSRGSHSDPQDDTGGFSDGERESYYLKTIETKTHVAVFYTTARSDSKAAPSSAFKSSATIPAQSYERLDKICLYPISDFQKTGAILSRDQYGNPILISGTKAVKTVYFDYDYSLCKGVPNNINQSGANSGKLTLTRVYFEYNGISKAKVSPYIFNYSYPASSTYPSWYASDNLPLGKYDLTQGYASLSSEDQNPNYNYFLTDPWGNYQVDNPNCPSSYNGSLPPHSRFKEMRPWVDQSISSFQNQNARLTDFRPQLNFDPAAWNLKRITLPSGGEIHIQYEQDDYAYVQDQEAHVMASLVDYNENGKYYIDLASIGLEGVSPTDDRITWIVQKIKERYVDKGAKMYFKFLYSLVGIIPVYLSSCNADFITGYSSVSDVGVDGTGLFVQFHAGQGLPVRVCKDFVKTQRLGKVYPGQDCGSEAGLNDGTNPAAIVMQLSSMLTSLHVPDDLCHDVDRAHSYLRIPTPLPKKGGGVRVKRLMMYTASVEPGTDPVLYGNEYLYEKTEGDRTITSGVASNEPQSIREENILTDFISRKGQKTMGAIIAGRDKDQSEGPVGESILPGPVVGYSRVVIKNIHRGNSDPGFSVNDFYTSKDYPIAFGRPDRPSTMTTINAPTPVRKAVSTPFYTDIITKTKATQGFSFVLNSMHGQPRSSSSYGGVYDPKLESATIVSNVSYEYFAPGEKIPVMSSLYGGKTMKNIGREVDLTFAQRQVTEKQSDVNVEVDLQCAIIPLAVFVLVIPYPTAIPSFSNVEGELSTHATTKVVRYPAILKRTTVYQNGITHAEENVAFDEFTGQPVAVRSSDEFKGAYLTQSIPASWEYQGMAGKFTSEGKKYTGAFKLSNGRINLGTDRCILEQFAPADQVAFRKTSGAPLSYYLVTDLDYAGNNLIVSSPNAVSDGPFTELTIVHSGKTNQLDASAGSITRHFDTEASADVVLVNQNGRYVPIAFGTALRNQVIAKIGTDRLVFGPDNFISRVNISGQYCNMDVSGFAGSLVGCNVDLTNATIKDLSYMYRIQDNQIVLDLMSFAIRCSAVSDPNCNVSTGSWTTVTSPGWNVNF